MTREDRAYNFIERGIENARIGYNTNKMVKNSKKANSRLKKGDFHAAKLAERKAEKFKMRAEGIAKYSKEKLIDIQHKSNDGDEIRHETKLRSINKIQ